MMPLPTLVRPSTASLCKFRHNKSSNLLWLWAARHRAFESTTSDHDQNNDIQTFPPDTEEPDLKELRDVSRLPRKIYSEHHGQAPEVPFKDLLHMKQRFARFGAASGEDPRILWPSRQQILAQEQKEMNEGVPLSERLIKLQTEKEEELRAVSERRKMIEKNMAQMPKWISEYHKKQKVLEKESEARAEKREVLLEEARDYFGYRVKPNDPKFQQMVEEKEERERKEAKKRKREEKMKKQADRLAAEIKRVSEITKEKSKTENVS